MKKLLILLFLPLQANSQIWDSVPFVVGESIYSMHVIDNKLWCSRPLIDSSHLQNNFNLVTWDGTKWENVGGGIDGAAYSIVKFNGDYFIGGGFTHAGGPFSGSSCLGAGTCIKNITKWDGNQFHKITDPNIIGGTINTLIVYNGELYAGGRFTSISGLNIKGLAKYNGGTSWSTVGGGLNNGNFVEVNSMVEFNGELVVTGFFNSAGGVPVLNVAKWNGSTWSALGNGFNAIGRTLVVDAVTNTLFAGGSFTQTATGPAKYVARFDGNDWVAMGNGLRNPVLKLYCYNDKVFAGMPAIDSTLAFWDGFKWTYVVPYPSSSGPIFNAVVNDFEVFQGEFYIGGGFTQIGNVIYRNIAKYTDTTTVISSVQNNSNAGFFKVYPNPFKNCISLRTTFKNTETEIVIRNTLGEIVYRRKEDLIRNDEISIDLSSLPQGVYFFNVKQNGFSKVKKIVKM